MSGLSCSREREVADLLHRGYWPEACGAELRAHVELCRSCADLVLVTQSFQAARKAEMQLPRLESAGALWWRAQLRKRNEAIAKVARPIFGAQIFALTVAIVVAGAVLVWQGNALKTWIEGLPQGLHLEMLVPASLTQTGVGWIVLPIVATVALLVSGLVVYVATEKQ